MFLRQIAGNWLRHSLSFKLLHVELGLHFLHGVRWSVASGIGYSPRVLPTHVLCAVFTEYLELSNDYRLQITNWPHQGGA
jgi:hypothetical protein